MRALPKIDDPNLLVGPESMSDAGVYRLADGLALVQTVDFFPPLVDDPFVYGQIAAANSLSDVYAMGGQPRTVLNIVGFPDDKLDLEILSRILEGGATQVAAAGAVVLGGHSVRDVEIKYGLAVTGVVDPAKMFTNAGARPGDVLVLTKPLGTGFVTTAFREGRCPPEVLDAACDTMIQLNRSAVEVAQQFGIKGSTDITGFGLIGHAHEMAEQSGVTLAIELSRLPILLGAEDLARAGYFTRANKTNAAAVEGAITFEGDGDPLRREFLYDPQTSGGLLLSVPRDKADEMVVALREAHMQQAAIIGEVHKQGAHVLVVRP